MTILGRAENAGKVGTAVPCGPCDYSWTCRKCGKVGTAVPCGPCDYSWTCRKCKTCRIPPLLMARATVPCRPHGMDPLNGPQGTAAPTKAGNGPFARAAGDGGPTKAGNGARQPHPCPHRASVPVERGGRSGETASPFLRNGITVPAQRHRRFKAFEHPFRAYRAGEKGVVDRDTPGF